MHAMILKKREKERKIYPPRKLSIQFRDLRNRWNISDSNVAAGGTD